MSDHAPSCEPGPSPSEGPARSGDYDHPAICWVLPFEQATGPANMALDHALLDRARQGGSEAFFRLYGWTLPTLSLGYFQRFSEIRPDLAARDVPMVRRLTGGGAIWHDRELTYCLILPRNHPCGRPSSALYQIVHGAIAEALGSLGAAVDQVAAGPPRSSAGERPFLCFNDPCEHDLAVGGVKVTGSAQRRREGVVLQHGSILLEASHTLPELLGLAEAVAGTPFAPEKLASRVTTAIAIALGMEPRPAQLSERILTHARELERSLYGNPEWTRCR